MYKLITVHHRMWRNIYGSPSAELARFRPSKRCNGMEVMSSVVVLTDLSQSTYSAGLERASPRHRWEISILERSRNIAARRVQVE